MCVARESSNTAAPRPGVLLVWQRGPFREKIARERSQKATSGEEWRVPQEGEREDELPEGAAYGLLVQGQAWQPELSRPRSAGQVGQAGNRECLGNER